MIQTYIFRFKYFLTVYHQDPQHFYQCLMLSTELTKYWMKNEEYSFTWWDGVRRKHTIYLFK